MQKGVVAPPPPDPHGPSARLQSPMPHPHVDRPPLAQRARSVRRCTVVLAILIAASLAGCESPPPNSSAHKPSTPKTSVTKRSPPTHDIAPAAGVRGGDLFGGNAGLVPDSTALGRKLAIVRTYYRIGESFPNSSDRALMETGITLVVSLDLPPGMTYAKVTDGEEDGVIRDFLQSMFSCARQYALRAIYFSFEHEPDTRKHGADPRGFIGAWDHVHSLAISLGVDWQQGGPIHWVWVLTEQAFAQGIARQYWPGSTVVDIVGEDAYNTRGCKHARPGSNFVASTPPIAPSQLFGLAVSFAESERKPLFITEWGSVPGPSSLTRSNFIRAVGAYVQTQHIVFALLYWDDHGKGNGCDYSIDNDRPALHAMAELAHSVRLAGVPYG